MMGWPRLTTFASLLVAAVPACSQSSPPSDSTDASAADSGDGGALVAQCKSLATTFVNNCQNEYSGDALTPDTERVCIWTVYAQLCGTGNTQLLVDSMSCFGENKNCWTFSDPNSAAGCLATVHATGESSAARAFFQSPCADCGGSSCDGGAAAGQAELVPYVSDDEIASLSACRGHACDNSSFAANCGSAADLGGFFACN
jgi:hypothetical protein